MHRRPHDSPSAARRGIAVLAAACLATLVLLVTGTSAAQAHGELVGSSPGAHARLDAAPAEVELQFGGAIQQLGTEVVVTAADGTPVSAGPVQVDGTTVVQRLTAGLPAGGYTVAWRATSADGHPLSDEFAFTVAGATPTTDVGEVSATSSADSSPSGARIAMGAAVVLLVGVLLAVRSLRRRS
jgi:copper resistance protein C